MAQKVHIVLIDDIDGSEASETVRFGLDGVTYEIDLNDQHAGELRESLNGWIEKARRRPGQRATRRSASDARGQSDAAKIRAWAVKEGIKVSDRGRIPADIRERYLEATSS
ncbi:Lsr2 protein [Bowdeniella nasicola]|uniref:Lsr2 protein n=1 Tax=Bowdeniella nasicola TaxID=208480 RepID=A0A1H3ZJL2_9ACTO|nr:Lsr2 family protein [Bowdeniella nasicola]SEA23472.1 Lsr2 protein [Bowdeniella nasicola]